MKVKASGLRAGDVLKDSGKVVSFVMPARGTHQMIRKTGSSQFFVVSFIGDAEAHVLEEFSILHLSERKKE